MKNGPHFFDEMKPDIMNTNIPKYIKSEKQAPGMTFKNKDLIFAYIFYPFRLYE